METNSIQWTSGYRYRLEADVRVWTPFIGWDFSTRWYALRTDGLLVIYQGYAWDGATKSLLQCIMWESVIHDALCQAINEGHLSNDLRPVADAFFKLLCRRQLVHRWKVLGKPLTEFYGWAVNLQTKYNVVKDKEIHELKVKKVAGDMGGKWYRVAFAKLCVGREDRAGAQ